MKKLIFLALSLCLIASYAIAQEETAPAAPAAAAETVSLSGVIIDNMCAGAQAPENLGSFVATHTKECALMPGCAASGYSIYADGKLAKFDGPSNKQIEEFLKAPESGLKVVVTAVKIGDELSLVSIENQK